MPPTIKQVLEGIRETDPRHVKWSKIEELIRNGEFYVAMSEATVAFGSSDDADLAAAIVAGEIVVAYTAREASWTCVTA